MSPDWIELLQILNEHKVRYLVVGGYAVMNYSEPRYTKDLDLWIEPTEENAQHLYNALVDFGLHSENLQPDTFVQKEFFYKIGAPPYRIDLITSIAPLEFNAAYSQKEMVTFEKVELSFISKADLIKAKEFSGRPVDLVDLDALKSS